MRITNEQRRKIISTNVKTLIKLDGRSIPTKAQDIGMSRATLYKILREGYMSDKSLILMSGHFDKDIDWFKKDHSNEHTNYVMKSLNNKNKTNDNEKEEETLLQDDISTMMDIMQKAMEILMDEMKKGYEENNSDNDNSITSQQRHKKCFNMYNYFKITINTK